MAIDWPSHFARAETSSRQLALKVAMVFAAIGIVWMLVAQIVVDASFRDPVPAARLQTALDWAFVLVAGIAVYSLARRSAVRLGRTRSVLSAVVASIGDGVVVLGPDGTIVHANPAALRMLDCDDDSSLVGLTFQQFARRFLVTDLNGALVAANQLASRNAVETDGAFRHRVVFHPSRHEELVIESTTAEVRTRPGKRAALSVTIFHDVTDTEHLEALRDRLFSSTAHALKTPIAIIKANVQFVARSSAMTSPSFLAIERQCNRIDRLVHNLQVVARARSRSLSIHLREMKLGPMMNEVARELESTDVHAIELDLVDTPPVYGDRERLELVLRNFGYAALRDSAANSTVRVILKPHKMSVAFGVRYVPLPMASRTFVGHQEYDDAALGDTANAAIIEAHGGELAASERDDDDDDDRVAYRWARIPMLETPRKHDA
jgi:signal transduction histidine kinase